MAFARYDSKGKVKRHPVYCDCSGDEPITEQSHKDEVNINNIVKRHGIDVIQKTNLLRSVEFQYDDVSGNDFQEAMQIVAKAQQTFDAMPSQLRKEFDNNPAVFLDFVQNPDNVDKMVDMGLAERVTPPPVVKVEVTNQPVIEAETPQT